ncbi:MAG: leucyl aminopeptidase [Deltaproteobacteria bacterium]|nr:leucyl aminopeptidase [Deltaproteobacteria bacterium]
MKISFHNSTIENVEAGLRVLPVTPERSSPLAKRPTSKGRAKTITESALAIPVELQEANKTFNGQLAAKLKETRFRARAGKRSTVTAARFDARGLPIPVSFRLSGVSPDALSPSGIHLDEWRQLGGDAASAALGLGVEVIAVSLRQVNKRHHEAIAEAVLEGVDLSQYRFTKFKSAKSAEGPKIREVQFLVREMPRRRAISADAQTAGVRLTRDLVNTPPSDMNPSDILGAARQIAKDSRGRIKLKVFDRSALQKMKAGSLLAVARGSDEPAYLIHLVYTPKRKLGTRLTVALVGKGVTFDSGGLSIKTGHGMMEMKCDMAGAACCLGVLRALIEREKSNPIGHEIHVVIPTCENMINGRAVKPGDVARAMNGKTIEILNTDAEGRLILADALAYTEKINPDVVIDVATLTGAVVVALGGDYAGLFANHDPLADVISEAAEEAGECMWQLPLAAEYRSHIDSSIADLKNISQSSGPGAIIGAIFLQEFVPRDVKWAHIDIAGPAFWTKSNEYTPAGGTGYGVRTLLRSLEKLNALTLK